MNSESGMPMLAPTGSSVSAPGAALEDEALVSAARRGDRAALGALHDRYAPLVHGILLSRLPPHDADDLAQDVFLRVMHRLGTLRDARAFPAWLAAMTRNFAAGFFRARQVRPRPSDDLPENAAPAAPPARGAEAAEVLATIRSLPETYAETLTLRLVEGMTGPQIAARTGMTHGSVRVNLHRGMALLRERLGIGDET